jgi:hypothetical protein
MTVIMIFKPASEWSGKGRRRSMPVTRLALRQGAGGGCPCTPTHRTHVRLPGPSPADAQSVPGPGTGISWQVSARGRCDPLSSPQPDILKQSQAFLSRIRSSNGSPPAAQAPAQPGPGGLRFLATDSDS